MQQALTKWRHCTKPRNQTDKNPQTEPAKLNKEKGWKRFQLEHEVEQSAGIVATNCFGIVVGQKPQKCSASRYVVGQ